MSEPIVPFCGICGNQFPMNELGGGLTLDYIFPTNREYVHRKESVVVCFVCAHFIEQFVTNVGSFTIRCLDPETRKALFPFSPARIDGGARWDRFDEVVKNTT